MAFLTKRHFLGRAKVLIEAGNANELRYAVLELRCCIEALTYEKLSASHNLLSDEAMSAWQAPQAVRYLLEMDPGADRGFKIFMGTEEVPGQPAKNMQFVGEHRSLNARWVRKHYNKLGSFLHAPHPKQAAKQKLPTQRYLREVAEELERICAANITGGWMASAFEFSCILCSKPIVCTEHKAASETALTCPHPNCSAEYWPLKQFDSTYSFHLMQTVLDCADCKAPIQVQNRDLAIGLRFVCPTCGVYNKIYERHWAYGVERTGSKG